MFLVQKRVELTFALHPETDAPRRGTNGVDHDRFRHFSKLGSGSEQAKVQIAVLPPRGGEAFVESAQLFKTSRRQKQLAVTNSAISSPASLRS
jgi:hypothetical protein